MPPKVSPEGWIESSYLLTAHTGIAGKIFLKEVPGQEKRTYAVYLNRTHLLGWVRAEGLAKRYGKYRAGRFQAKDWRWLAVDAALTRVPWSEHRRAYAGLDAATHLLVRDVLIVRGTVVVG